MFKKQQIVPSIAAFTLLLTAGGAYSAGAMNADNPAETIQQDAARGPADPAAQSGETGLDPHDMTAGTFVAVHPYRAFDSRDGGGAVSADKHQSVQISHDQNSVQRIPNDAKGIFYNLTAVNGTSTGFISVNPGDFAGTPATSTVNYTGDTIVANGSFVMLSEDPMFQPMVSVSGGGLGAAEFVIDITGYVK